MPAHAGVVDFHAETRVRFLFASVRAPGAPRFVVARRRNAQVDVALEENLFGGSHRRNVFAGWPSLCPGHLGFGDPRRIHCFLVVFGKAAHHPRFRVCPADVHRTLLQDHGRQPLQLGFEVMDRRKPMPPTFEGRRGDDQLVLRTDHEASVGEVRSMVAATPVSLRERVEIKRRDTVGLE
jgi:hypothetical protein